MSGMSLPILGQGSQPPEQDGSVLDYLRMPQEMSTFSMPSVSLDLNAVDLTPAKSILNQLQQALNDFPEIFEPIDLTPLNAENRRFIDEVLGEGEVSLIFSGNPAIHIQESVLAGVWRLQGLKDELEVGAMPQSIFQSTFKNASPRIDTSWDELPEGIMNAPPLLTEINAKLSEYQPGADAHSINLSLLPQTEQDLAFLTQRLGAGEVTILSRGYGNCRISSTNTRYVWWVRYFNSDDSLILNTLEVSEVPGVALASPEDIADSKERLQEIMRIYR